MGWEQEPYFAFLSYSHADEKLVARFHRKLENKKLPKFANGKKKLFPIFRDEDELPMSSDLGGAIEKALCLSKYLIVFISDTSIQSNWVRAEIELFLEKNGLEQLIVIFTKVETIDLPDDHPLYNKIDCVISYNIDRLGFNNTIAQVSSTLSGVPFRAVKTKEYINRIIFVFASMVGISATIVVMIVLGSIFGTVSLNQVYRAYAQKISQSEVTYKLHVDKLQAEITENYKSKAVDINRLTEPLYQFGIWVGNLEEGVVEDPEKIKVYSNEYIVISDNMLEDLISNSDSFSASELKELYTYKARYEKVKAKLKE